MSDVQFKENIMTEKEFEEFKANLKTKVEFVVAPRGFQAKAEFVVAPRGFQAKAEFEKPQEIIIVDDSCSRKFIYTPHLEYIPNDLLGMSHYNVTYTFEEIFNSCDLIGLDE